MTGPQHKPQSRELSALVGKTVRGTRRVFFAFRGEIDTEEGPLELNFDDGSVVLFRSGSDGQQLVIENQAWRDPFAEAPSEENREYVERHGKWTAFDTSGDAPYVGLIGCRIERVQAITLRDQSIADGFPVDEMMKSDNVHVDFDAIVGAVLEFNALAVGLEVVMDELRVTFSGGDCVT